MRLLTFVSFLFFYYFNLSGQTDPIFQDYHILVLDMQEHFLTNKLDDSTATQTIEAVNEVIRKGDPEKILFIRSILTSLTLSLHGSGIDTLPGLELDERILMKDPLIFEKNRSNAFLSESLNSYLDSVKAEKIIVIGLMAEHCVYHTIRGGLKKGHAVYAIPEAIAAGEGKDKEKILRKLEKKGLIIID